MPKIDATTKLCAVIGHPIAHSLSPAMHNAAFDATGLNYVYVAFDIHEIGHCLALDHCTKASCLMVTPEKLGGEGADRWAMARAYWTLVWTYVRKGMRLCGRHRDDVRTLAGGGSA